MKSFKEFQNISEIRNKPTPVNAPSDSDLNLNDLRSDEIVARINRFVGSIADKEYLNPQQAVDELKEKLGRIGLGFEAKIEGDKGSQTVEVKQFGGRFGKDIDGADINDDGISHRKEGGLKMEINHEKMSNNTSKVFAKLV